MLPKGDPERVDPYANPSEAMLEGDKMHKAFEASVMYGAALPAEYAVHTDVINMVRTKAADSKNYRVSCEKQMAISTKLKSTGWFDKQAWGRATADVEIHKFGDVPSDPNPALTFIDWKSGKPRDSWLPQGAAMAAVAFFNYPGADQIRWEVRYVNHGVVKECVFERANVRLIFQPILKTTSEIKDANSAGDWPMKESALCGWCAVYDCPNNPNG